MQQRGPKELKAPPPHPIEWRVRLQEGKRYKLRVVKAQTAFKAAQLAFPGHHFSELKITPKP